MHTFTVADRASKPDLYRDLVQAGDALTSGERDGIANMANIAALMWQYLPDVNWTGFYRLIEGELVLGPFCGKPACIRIAMGQGVCGTAAERADSVLVADVHAFPGHIACDADSASELVVPVLRDGRVVAVIDLDSPQLGRFDEQDRAGIISLAAVIADRI